MLHFRNITKIYQGQQTALKDINLDIEPGEFVSIVGQSGTGKTTLVKLILAEERPTKGQIVIGGWDITDIKQREIPTLRRQIGVVFQDFKLLPRKTLFENVAFALEVCGAQDSRIIKIVPQILEIVGLEKKMRRYPDEISGGEQQRVVIARSLVHAPKIVIADEPSGNLDAINTDEIVSIFKKINELGTTVLLVTHNREMVNALRRRVVTIDKGSVSNDQAEGKYVL